MLGGYYLGQQYLGISGLPNSGAITVQDSNLGLIDNSKRIINWADYQYFTGIYIKDFGSSGVLEESGNLEAGTLILQKQKIGSFEPAATDSGVFTKTTSKQGQLN